MAKVEGTWASVTKGVSQQAPADRLEGQHGEVVNMLSDPVRGLVRRNGMIAEAIKVKKFSANPGDALLDSYSFRIYPYRDGGRDYDVLYRSRARVGNSDAHLDALTVRDKTEGTTAWIPAVRPAVDAPLDLFESGGISAITNIGSYVLLAANTVAPSYGTTLGIDNLGWVGAASVWVRGGSYARTFRVQAKRRSDGALFDVSYTTPVSTYPGVLDIAGFMAQFPGVIGTPYEQYFVNVAQAQFDTAVNQWSASASAAIVPSNIAQELATRLTNAGLPGWSIRGSHMLHDDLAWVEVSDGGNGEFFRAVLTDVKSPDDVTDIARVGKVIRVQPSSNQTDAYYLQAFPKVDGNTDPFQTVIWREAAGLVQQPSLVFAMGRIVGTTFYWASGPAALKALILAQTGTTVDVPVYVDSTAGDIETVRPPHFFGKQITMLTTFQDRLLIGSGSVVNASEVGDYFNFYRTTMLTIPSSDPTEITAAGTESDTIRTAVMYDRNLMLQGDLFHYAINGKAAFDAANPQMSVQFKLSGSAYAQPLGIGKFVYVLKEDAQLAASRLMQVQAGVYQDSPEINDVSKQLRNYVNGSPAEMVALTSPSAVFVRTEHFLKSQGGFPRARPWGLYLYQYLDADDGVQRLQEAWSAWEWSSSLGTPVGISETNTGDAIYLYTLAFGADQDGDRAQALMVQKASARPDPTGLPYLDGLQVASAAEATGLFTPAAVQVVRDVTFTSPGAAHSYSPVPATTDADRFTGLEHPHYTVGDAPPEGVDDYRWTGVNGYASTYLTAFPAAPQDNLWTGVAFPAFVDLTNPYVRDRDGKAQTQGELNLTEFKLTVVQTAGVQSSWVDHDGTKVVEGFKGTYERIRYNQPVWIGRESKDVQVRVAAVDWLPLTISGIAWKANWFAYRGRA